MAGFLIAIAVEGIIVAALIYGFKKINPSAIVHSFGKTAK